MDSMDINNKINCVTRRVLERLDIPEMYIKDESILQIILSESSLALEFVTALEFEFDIEFDDEEIDLSFFTNFQHIQHLINKHIHTNI
jgi:acyl carrier protein